MKHIQLFLFGEGMKSGKRLDLASDATVSDVVSQYLAVGDHDPNGTYYLFIEGEEVHRGSEELLSNLGKHGALKVQVHRCQKVKISIRYNGVSKEFSVPPSMTVQALLNQAVHSFGIPSKESSNMGLSVADGTMLDKTSHIGSYVGHDTCALVLSLVALQNIQG